MKMKILCIALVIQFESCKNNDPKEILLDFKPNENLITFKKQIGDHKHRKHHTRYSISRHKSQVNSSQIVWFYN